MGRLRILLLATALISFPCAVFAQSSFDIDQASRETILQARSIDKIKEQLNLRPGRGLPQPAALVTKEIPSSKEETFFIRNIKLKGCLRISEKELYPTVTQYENHQVTLTQLNNLAKQLEAFYLKHGLIAAVFVPQQDISNETVYLQVVEARMGQIETPDLKYFKPRTVKQYWEIPEGNFLEYEKISRSLQRMNKNPDRDIRASLQAGKTTGATDVVLTSRNRFPMHLSASIDNEGSPTTGKVRKGIGIRHNNFLGLDDAFLSGYNFGKDFSGSYIYHWLPLNARGLSLLYGYNRSKSQPRKDYNDYGIISLAENTSVSLRQDLFHKDNYIGELIAGFESKDKTTKMHSGTSNRDRLRVLNLGATISASGKYSTFFISPEINQGISGLGASSRNNPLASRNASSVFTKANLKLGFKQQLPWDMQLNINNQTQVASNKLTPQEEFSLGGIDSVRGYPSGDYLADNANQTNIELLLPSPYIPSFVRLPLARQSLKDDVTTVLFFDNGWGSRRGSTNDIKDTTMVSAGAGWHIRLYDQANLRLEWGFPLADNPPLTETANSYFHFAFDLQEHLPDELQRISELRTQLMIEKTSWQIINRELSRPNSLLRRKIMTYLSYARYYYHKHQLSKARYFYQRFIQLAEDVHEQAVIYLRQQYQNFTLAKIYRTQALKDYQDGKLKEAKTGWAKIRDICQPQPLILKF